MLGSLPILYWKKGQSAAPRVCAPGGLARSGRQGEPDNYCKAGEMMDEQQAVPFT